MISHIIFVFLYHIVEFPSVTICNVNQVRLSALTKWDVFNMGPQLEFTDEEINLRHSEMYAHEWYEEMFINTNWSDVSAEHEGT